MKKFCEWWDSFKKRINELPKTNIFLYVVVILLCIGFTLSICKINHLNSRLDTQNNLIYDIIKGDKQTEQQLKYQQFKEDSYIRQQDRDTTLILLIVPVFFAMFGYFTFKLSSDEFAFFKNEMIRNYDEQKAANQSVHKQLVKTQNDLYYLL